MRMKMEEMEARQMLRPYKKPLALDLAGSFDAFLDCRGWLAQALVAQFIVFYARHLNVDVDAVEQGAGDALLVFRDDAR